MSISSVYLYNWTNTRTQYQSGQEINVDYGVGYHVTPALQFGASGYLYKQVTDDRLNGQASPAATVARRLRSARSCAGPRPTAGV